jgi:hypothetical protein
MAFVDFKAKAIELVKQAVEQDNAQNYEEALRLYKASLEHFSLHLKYEKNPSAKKTITAKARAGGQCLHSATHAADACPSCATGGCAPSVFRVQFTEYLARAEELQKCVLSVLHALFAYVLAPRLSCV